MHKCILIILLFCQITFVNAQKNNISLTSETDMLIINESNRILRTDTIYCDSTGIQEIVGYDGWNQIVKKEIRDLDSSLGLMGLRIEVYDLNGNLFIEQVEDHDGIIWHQYMYIYTDMNRLKTKMGFSSGEIGHKIEYKYSRSGVLLSEIEYRFGKKVKKIKHK